MAERPTRTGTRYPSRKKTKREKNLRDALIGKEDAPPSGFGSPLNYPKAGVA
jgi:hypothetical protein